MHIDQNITMAFWYVPSKQAVEKVKEYIFKINLYYFVFFSSWYISIENVAGIDTIESELRRHSDDGQVMVMEAGT